MCHQYKSRLLGVVCSFLMISLNCGPGTGRISKRDLAAFEKNLEKSRILLQIPAGIDSSVRQGFF